MRGGFLKACIGVASSVLGLLAAEGVVRLAAPQVTLFPRWEASAAYGLIFPANAEIVHRQGGRWEFRYTTGPDHHRAPPPPESTLATENAADATAEARQAVILGDSYTFGMGVADGEEYPAQLERALAGRWRVRNLGIPGWGLAQQIRRYREVQGDRRPAVVILQFSGNDPAETLEHPVIGNDDGRWVLHDKEVHATPAWVRSRWLQSSHLYAGLRNIWSRRHINRAHAGAEADPAVGAAYAELLRAWAHDLHAQGVPLWLIAVDGQLEAFPAIREAADALAAEGCLTYLETRDWLIGDAAAPSPEGHRWGAAAHARIGRELAHRLEQAFPAGTPPEP